MTSTSGVNIRSPYYDVSPMTELPADVDESETLDQLALEHQYSSMSAPLSNPRSQMDLAGLVAALNESMAATSSDVNETKLKYNQENLKKAVDELKAQLQAAMQQAEASKHKRHGWFDSFCDAIGSVFEAIGKFVGAVVGTVADFVVDTIMQPIDIIKGLIKGENIKALFEQEFHDMTTNGSVAKTVDDCCQAIFNFVGDLTKFANSLIGAMEAGLRGENVGEMLKGECKELWHSLKRNIINNPAVMKVVGVVLKLLAVVALALGTVSFGVGAIIAVGLLALAELNERTNLAKKLLGDKVGGWVTIGLRLAATVASLVCLGGEGSSSGLDTVNSLLQVGAVLQGASAISTAVDQYEAFNKKADERDSQGTMLEILNRIQRLQRNTDYLLESMEHDTEGWDRNRSVAGQLAQTQGATLEAALMPA